MKGWKIKKFGSDLVYDLRKRGLLPVAGLLLVAIFVAPILISKSGSDSGSGSGPQTAGVKPAPEGQNAVLAYSPGLRNYRKRLDDLSSKNPFKQQFRDSVDSGDLSSEAQASAADFPGSSFDGGNTGGTGDTGDNGGDTGGDNGGGGGASGQDFYIRYQTDVNVGESGSTLSRRNNVPEFTLLPSQQTAAAVFMGPSADGGQAIFSVSRSVTSVSGQGICYPEPDDCEILGLAPGQGADLSYSPDGKTYRFEVLRIKRVKSTQP